MENNANDEFDYAIVRTYSAGAFAGYLQYVDRANKTATLYNSRQLWRWHTKNNGLSLSEVAEYGLNHSKSKITCPIGCRIVPYVEILFCTKEAQESIETAESYVHNGN